MRTIRIVNIKNYIPNKDEAMVKIDRSTALGNIFIMEHEKDRDKVCDLYKKYFETEIITNWKMQVAINIIIETIRDGRDIALGCWCAPKRCHGETVLEYILKKLKDTDIKIKVIK